MSALESSARKLEPFLLMAKSAKGAAAAKLVENATAAPGVFVFAELLEHPNIQELANNPQHAPSLELLKLFSYGTYEDYKQHKDSLPPLNPAQLVKLKNLSIVSLAEQSRILPYAQLRAYLDITTLRELEDLIIDAMYQDVLKGRLDQKEQQLELEYTMGRDIRPGQLEQLLAALKDWSSQTEQVINALDTKLTQIVAHQDQQRLDTDLFIGQRSQMLIEVALQKKMAKRSNTGGGSVADMGAMAGERGGSIDDMDIDSGSAVQQPGGGGFGSSFFGLMDRKKKSAPGGPSGSASGASGPGNARKRNRP
ncbi:hypothetical protein M407DRAFT_244880 [Tulasnella calospora MUT 4182]|uniref:PCI domain-containing protein n=1 Tax=Tulasnella calospora MUT 4182 TaxID=1051891 RepID=A0A0C3LP27_9AGAM|nr:hypothetical protein M407DRAFT_244880 [Tulasnella calospora MUT 4182]